MGRRHVPEDRESGSMHVMTIPIAVGMLSAAVLVITLLGSATNDRRETGTAADAAALAAAQEWDEHLGLLHGLHLMPGGFSEFWGIIEEVLLTVVVKDKMQDAAEEYAERNGAEVVGRLDFDPESLEVTVRVRHEDEVPIANVRSKAEATAQIRLNGGLCQDDGGLGWMIDGECVTEPDPADVPDEAEGDEEQGEENPGDAEPGDDEGDEDDEEPVWEAPEVDGYASRIVLVD